jgi:hypothetical protein
MNVNCVTHKDTDAGVQQGPVDRTPVFSPGQLDGSVVPGGSRADCGRRPLFGVSRSAEISFCNLVWREEE